MADDLDRLFRLYQRELQQLARRRVSDGELAADLVQDTFLRYAGMDAKGRQAVESPRFFLWRILGNLIVDWRRGNARRGIAADLDEVQDELFDPRPSPERMLELTRQLQSLHAALAELPENCRSALLLNRLEGLGHIEIGQRLGVSASMVSKYIMQALRHCARRCLLEP
ncbi:putative RNA polymerase sigma factor FecI [compost metagenome]|uniref:RNA polymerase sigma-70 factor, ECF subfamily n=1 Tax=Pseudomonas jinjuensis TaxID=198616 RepID=A0A1H0JFF2_9PSED|nr:RNA polymerase sigma factor [Pseudomonas jinjuensis]SDO42525.1 RNA polymerase sigma-70 factor, ECF subfamily [Pseudomonas jinjuensis]